MPFHLERTQDLGPFQQAALPFLRAHAAEYSQLLLAAERLTQESIERNGDWLCYLREGDDLVAAGIYSGNFPPQHLSLTEWPPATHGMLAAAFAGMPVARLVAPTATADALAAAFGLERLMARLLSYAMHKPAAMRAVAGHAENLRPARMRLLAEWIVAFEIECGFPPREVSAVLDDLEQRRPPLGSRRYDFWMCDGAPVAMTGIAQSGSTARIGPVYTPPEQRGHGYGGALVAFLSNEALANGAERVCLFADAANPISNTLYRRIGFEYLGEFGEYGPDSHE